MKHRVRSLASAALSIESLYFAAWVAVLIIAVILQVAPVVLVVMMFSLAIGVPKEIALNVVPVVFVVVMYFSCLIASKFAGRPGAGWKTGRSDPGPRTWSF